MRIGFVYDAYEQFVDGNNSHFPADITAEWESPQTVAKMISTWQELGYEVVLMPVDNNFFARWHENIAKCSLIHSVVEGWGALGREGWIPALCELSGIPYIGSGPYTQSLCMSKTQTKLTAQHLQIPTAQFYLIKDMDGLDKVPDIFLHAEHFIKPDGEGSSMGIDGSTAISSSRAETYKLLLELLKKYPGGILLEKYLSGVEYTTACIGSPLKFLPIAQIEVDGVYDQKNKTKDYMPEKITFPNLANQLQHSLQLWSEQLCAFLDIKDFVRIDWKCDADGNAHLLEINPLAGLSYYYSVLPVVAKAGGINYKELFAALANSAMQGNDSRNLLYGKAIMRFS